ncbi:GSCOCG00004595001-RA-CDS [Cotesia congregata]|uniref:Calcyclin-binding protein n=1 Tax=Cotesia congregata TaxID=51543 RepID=A0A8J2HDJ4_COTCN|nr:GSCOCG00004595001-RA-CDS [Cotesia congregata]CAG5095078.1 Similar to CACYBP: Calcyclin-binding protein (Bos taurus) [Cotesia congregata]
MASKIEDIKLDIDELNSLLLQAKRQKVKDMLALEVRRLQTELTKIMEANKNEENKNSKPAVPAVSDSKCYEVKLTNYAWDQSDKFIKLYVTLKNVQSLSKEAVACNFSERSIDLRVMGLENRNYQLPISNLCEDIDPSKSYIKVKTDMIVVFLSKKASKNWTHVTGIEKRIKESKNAPPSSDNADPEAGLMNIMKKMYQEGDDEMKRTIAKAWTESQEKKTASLDNFPSI